MIPSYVNSSTTNPATRPAPDNNNALHDRTLEAQSDIMDAATKAASAVAQAILTNTPTGSHSPRGVKVADPEYFNGCRDRAEQFV